MATADQYLLLDWNLREEEDRFRLFVSRQEERLLRQLTEELQGRRSRKDWSPRKVTK